MKFTDMFREVLSTLSANRMRSALTIFGIVIGVWAVITMTSLVGSMGSALSSSFGSSQSKLISISTKLDATKSDFETLAAQMPEYSEIILSKTSSADMTQGSQTATESVVGTQSSYAEANGLTFTSGSFYSADDEASARRVCAIGRGVVKDLFGSEDAEAVGKQVIIGDDTYTVLGVLEAAEGTSTKESVFVPLNTMEIRMGAAGSYTGTGVIAGDSSTVNKDALIEKTMSTFATILNASKPSESITVYSEDMFAQSFQILMVGFQILMAAVASISLLVGGIGIMNMMLTNVTERIREIGLRKALGAHEKDIVRQFLLESIVLTMMGGAIGIVLGYISAYALTAIIIFFQPGLAMKPAVGIQSVLIAAGVSIAIGVIFGFYPARRAARLDPIESLRYQ